MLSLVCLKGNITLFNLERTGSLTEKITHWAHVPEKHTETYWKKHERGAWFFSLPALSKLKRVKSYIHVVWLQRSWKLQNEPSSFFQTPRCRFDWSETFVRMYRSSNSLLDVPVHLYKVSDQQVCCLFSWIFFDSLRLAFVTKLGSSDCKF